MTMAEHKSNIKLTKDIPYLALMGKLWDVFWEDLGENLPRYNGTALYRINPTCSEYTVPGHRWINVACPHSNYEALLLSKLPITK